MDAFARDLRFALRLIRKAPVLSIATIVPLALVAFVTMLGPAKRATGVSPSVALRTE